MTDQPLEADRFLKYTLIYILINIIGDGMGLTIGAFLDPIVSDLPTPMVISDYSIFFENSL